MTKIPVAGSHTAHAADRPKAVGFVRSDVSGSNAPRHAADVQRHACAHDYQYVYTVRPPADVHDPIGYLLAMATELEVDAIVVYGLEHVDNQPAPICDAGFDLETVCPHSMWTRSAQPVRAGSTVAGGSGSPTTRWCITAGSRRKS